MPANLCQSCNCLIERLVGFAAIITSQYTDVIVQFRKDSCQTAYRSLIHVYMHIADVKNREFVKVPRNTCGSNHILTHFKAFSVSPSAPIQTQELQRGSNNEGRITPTLETKGLHSIAKNTLLVVAFDT